MSERCRKALGGNCASRLDDAASQYSATALLHGTRQALPGINMAFLVVLKLRDCKTLHTMAHRRSSGPP